MTTELKKLRATMAYLCDKYPYPNELSNARLTKLVYLADWEASRLLGRQLTGVSWVFNHYGPWVPDVLEVAQRDGHFRVVSETNAYGSPKTRIAVEDPESLHSELSPVEKAILDRVMDRTRGLYFGQFIDYVYATYPVKSQNRYATFELAELAAEANAIEPPEPLKAANDRTSVTLTEDERDMLRSQVEGALRKLLGSRLPGAADDTLEYLDDASIEWLDSDYDLDINIGDAGALRVGTQVDVAVEGFVYKPELEDAQVRFPDLEVLDFEWSESWAWVSVPLTYWMTLSAVRRADAAQGWDLTVVSAGEIGS